MPIIFITLSETFANLARDHGYDARVQPIQDYQPRPTARRTYYVSPANSLCFMDGGIDLALSRQVFPGIEPIVKQRVRKLGRQTLLGRPYLPIGSSLITDGIDDPGQPVSGPTSHTPRKSLVVAPTMLLPQAVPHSQNAYYATMAVLYNILINRGENLDEVDVLLTSFCCGYGRMSEQESLNQILDGIRDYPTYCPLCLSETVILAEPNLPEQPKYYQNTEWMDILPNEIQKC